jgi:hypothetical protein
VIHDRCVVACDTESRFPLTGFANPLEIAVQFALYLLLSAQFKESASALDPLSFLCKLTGKTCENLSHRHVQKIWRLFFKNSLVFHHCRLAYVRSISREAIETSSSEPQNDWRVPMEQLIASERGDNTCVNIRILSQHRADSEMIGSRA